MTLLSNLCIDEVEANLADNRFAG
ncbi:uncharacterized protein METZ01_LOCUS472582, partial [marine metagenome]